MEAASNPPSDEEPTIFHITHWKAGSQWVHRIFHHLDYPRLVLPQGDQGQFLREPIRPGKVYPTLYVTTQRFDAVSIPKNSRRFVIIRDLRDTLVSLYWSVKQSHAAEQLFGGSGHRAVLARLDVENGLLILLDELLPACADIQRSWLQAGEKLFRYEDLLEDDLRILERILLDHCELRVSRERFREIVLANRFERLTGGRRRGEEDTAAHERKGIRGDWKNYFTDPVKRRFKDRYGDLLIAIGYEPDFDW
jgi:sulfotransferase family protein